MQSGQMESPVVVLSKPYKKKKIEIIIIFKYIKKVT